MAYRLGYKAKTTEFVQQNVSFHPHNNYRHKNTNQKRKKMVNWTSSILLLCALQKTQLRKGKGKT